MQITGGANARFGDRIIAGNEGVLILARLSHFLSALRNDYELKAPTKKYVFIVHV
jgi:hypothetical protein